VILATLAASLSVIAAPSCAPTPGRQLVTVQAASTRTTYATVRLWTRPNARACWRLIAGPWPARVGRNGLSSHHREGDGTTPIGAFGFGPTVYGLGPNPATRLGFHALRCGDWWDEDPASRGYNTFLHVACGTTRPFRGGSEALWKQTTAYRYFAVIEYNAAPVVPGRGSAIFLHAATGGPTNGCVSLRLSQLVRTLRWLNPDLDPRITITG
jgi:L,D-peptidoglycan transpeptidase YkuD (ErfK/YbiS/YcfS/YnhG family)